MTLARLATALTLLAGCQATDVAPIPLSPQTVLPEVGRQVLPPDVSQVVARRPPDSPDPGPYLALGAEETCQLARIHSGPAQLLERAAAAPSTGRFGHVTKTDALRRTLAGHLAAEARQQSAAAALDVYYQLLEAELLADALGAALGQLDALATEAAALEAAGFPVPPEAATLRSQTTTARRDRETARAGARRLNAELLALIGATPGAGRINPTDPLTLHADQLDVNLAVSVALANRPDLAAVRTLEAGLDTHTMALVNAAFASLTPGLPEAPTGPLAVVQAAFQPDSLGPTRLKLMQLRQNRERNAITRVHAAHADWESGQIAVAAAKMRVEEERGRVTEQEAKTRATNGGAADLRRARLALGEAEADLTRAVIRWKRADVALRLELGLLGGR